MQIAQCTIGTAGKSVQLDALKIPFGYGQPEMPPWEKDDEETQEQADESPESRIAASQAAIRGAGRSGGRVRIMQMDGSLREFDMNLRRYVD